MRSTKHVAALLVCLFNLAASQSPATLSNEVLNTNITSRQDLCHIQQRVKSGELELRDALKGLTLSFAGFVAPGDFNVDETGALNHPDADPGLVAIMMDELARRGGFTYRNSMGIYQGPEAYETTWTSLLFWAADTHDVVGSWWLATAARQAEGVSFPEGWYDASLMVVTMEEDQKSKLNLASWQRPFNTQVWIYIVLAMGFSAFIFWIIERHQDPDSDLKEESHSRNVLHSLFLAAGSFTGGAGYSPTTLPGRLFVISWTFWCLLVVSAYTANLASFLIVEKRPAFAVQSIGDAVNNGLPVCLETKAAAYEETRAIFPNINVIPGNSRDEVFSQLNSGKCTAAVSEVNTWEQVQGMSQYNGDCRLSFVGRVFRPFSAGFAVQQDSGILCTSIIRDVLDLHMKEMKNDDFVADEWDRHLSKTSNVNCLDEESAVDDEEQALTPTDMAGVFLMHGTISIMACVAALAMGIIRHRWNLHVHRLASIDHVHHSDEPPDEDGSAKDVVDGANEPHAPKQKGFSATGELVFPSFSGGTGVSRGELEALKSEVHNNQRAIANLDYKIDKILALLGDPKAAAQLDMDASVVMSLEAAKTKIENPEPNQDPREGRNWDY